MIDFKWQRSVAWLQSSLSLTPWPLVTHRRHATEFSTSVLGSESAFKWHGTWGTLTYYPTLSYKWHLRHSIFLTFARINSLSLNCTGFRAPGPPLTFFARKITHNICEVWWLSLTRDKRAGADPGEVKWVNFHPPFSEPPSFFFFLSLKYWLVLIHYYKNSPPPFQNPGSAPVCVLKFVIGSGYGYIYRIVVWNRRRSRRHFVTLIATCRPRQHHTNQFGLKRASTEINGKW